jgi:hypothetical protein
MRNILIIGMVLVGASMAGWFKVQRDGERTTIEFNRDEIRSDANKAIDRGREFLDRRDPGYADQQTDQSQLTGQGQQQAWPQEQVATQQQQQQWGTTYDPRQQPNDGGAYKQVQFYNDGNQQNQQTGNQPVDQGQANPYQQQQNYRR